MKRKSVIAKLLALSLVVSGLPMTPLYAAELPAAAEAQTQENKENPAAEAVSGEESAPEKEGTDQQEKETPEGQQKDTTDGQEKETAEGQEKDTADRQEKETSEGQEKDTADGQEKDTSDGQEKETSGSQEKESSDGQQTKDVIGEEGIAEAAYFGIPKDAKMAGSDGVFYDDVTYLSARNVMAMDAEMQAVYQDLCDDISYARAEGMDIEDVVFAVNADGDLYCNYYVPGVVLEGIEQEFLSDVTEILTPAVEETQKTNEGDVKDENETKDGGSVVKNEEDKKDDESSVKSEEDKKDDETDAKDKDQVTDDKKDDTDGKDQDQVTDDKKDDTDGRDQVTDDKKDESDVKDQDQVTDDKKDDTDGKDQVTDDKKDDTDGKDQVTDDKKDESDVKDQDQVTDDKQDENDVKDKDQTTDDKKDDGTDAKDEDAVEKEKKEKTASEQEIPEEELILSEENMDLLPSMEEETFEVVESARVEPTIDFGYGSAVSDEDGMSGIQFAAILPTGDYFTKQLTSKQKEYYNAAKGKLLGGSNSFSFQDSLSAASSVADNVAHAVSAMILTYPDKTDWMAKPGGFKMDGRYYRGSTTANYTITFDKSKYYSGSLDSSAKSQVQSIATQAMQYAATSYAQAPVYGVVKYFDQWICANNYYEMGGTESGRKDDLYYYCHSAYGILLKGYGVCESYAKAMSRMLDAVGIPNIYVVGMAATSTGVGGHAWNYVQMPDGNWYLLDSTWNDSTNISQTTSNGRYLLAADDGQHLATGCNYNGERPDFNFPSLASSKYAPGAAETVTLSETECNLSPKETVTLKAEFSGSGAYKKMKGVWASSNTKVATVSNGKVTAKAAGTAEITYTIAGMVGRCTVYVDQIKSLKIKESKATKETLSLGINGGTKETKEIVLAVDMGASPHDAAWLQKNKQQEPKITNSKSSVATVSTALAGNEIKVKFQAGQAGKTTVTVAFGGKKVTFTVSAGQLITKEMFDITWPAAVTGADGAKTVEYTGKAVKPTIKKKADAAYKAVTYKVNYVNNKNAGNAKVVIMGSGKYGGMVEYPFTITPISAANAKITKDLKSKAYNGGKNAPAAEVKLGSKKLKAGTDYDILYNGKTGEELMAANDGAIPAGSYTITFRGKGNYTGMVSGSKTYQVTQNTITKVKVSGSSSTKYTGVPVNPFKVKIGSNTLPAKDYKITWYSGQGKTKTLINGAPVAKGKYTAVVTVQGGNLTTTAKKTEITKKLTIK